MQVLCGNSSADVDWLVDKCNLSLSMAARSRGLSIPRTHRGKERFPGMTIAQVLIHIVEKIAERTTRARIVTKAKAHKLVMRDESCTGLVYENKGQDQTENGPVLLCFWWIWS